LVAGAVIIFRSGSSVGKNYSWELNIKPYGAHYGFATKTPRQPYSD